MSRIWSCLDITAAVYTSGKRVGKCSSGRCYVPLLPDWCNVARRCRTTWGRYWAFPRSSCSDGARKATNSRQSCLLLWRQRWLTSWLLELYCTLDSLLGESCFLMCRYIYMECIVFCFNHPHSNFIAVWTDARLKGLSGEKRSTITLWLMFLRLASNSTTTQWSSSRKSWQIPWSSLQCLKTMCRICLREPAKNASIKSLAKPVTESALGSQRLVGVRAVETLWAWTTKL